jgi:hypothetical protein
MSALEVENLLMYLCVKAPRFNRTRGSSYKFDHVLRSQRVRGIVVSTLVIIRTSKHSKQRKECARSRKDYALKGALFALAARCLVACSSSIARRESLPRPAFGEALDRERSFFGAKDSQDWGKGIFSWVT